MTPPTDKENNVKRSDAFTLVEMMVVMAILLILAALVYPSYASYVVKARRVEAQSALLRTMQDQERYYTQYNTYLPFTAERPGDENMSVKWWLGESAARSAYELSGRACGALPLAACIELRAEPGTGRVDATFRDPECETLTLDSTGRHGAGGRATGCWP